MKKSLYAFVLLVWLSSCIVEESTETLLYIVNATRHQLKILPYKSGLVSTTDTILIGPFQKIRVFGASERGITGRPPLEFAPYLRLRPEDSIIVRLDDTLQATHYVTAPLGRPAAKYYAPESSRSFLNLGEAYETTQEDHKYYRVFHCHYVFSEADYDYIAQ